MLPTYLFVRLWAVAADAVDRNPQSRNPGELGHEQIDPEPDVVRVSDMSLIPAPGGVARRVRGVIGKDVDAFVLQSLAQATEFAERIFARRPIIERAVARRRRCLGGRNVVGRNGASQREENGGKGRVEECAEFHGGNKGWQNDFKPGSTKL